MMMRTLGRAGRSLSLNETRWNTNGRWLNLQFTAKPMTKGRPFITAIGFASHTERDLSTMKTLSGWSVRIAGHEYFQGSTEMYRVRYFEIPKSTSKKSKSFRRQLKDELILHMTSDRTMTTYVRL